MIPLNSCRSALAIGALAALIAITGCSQEPTTYTTDTKDESGGELIVEDANSTGVPVNLPDTPMTNVPSSEAAN